MLKISISRFVMTSKRIYIFWCNFYHFIILYSFFMVLVRCWGGWHTLWGDWVSLVRVFLFWEALSEKGLTLVNIRRFMHRMRQFHQFQKIHFDLKGRLVRILGLMFWVCAIRRSNFNVLAMFDLGQHFG